ncbi:STAS/SEC14 domain-containing protein [Roseobacter sp.]|uniref:STAS/SEC14 domain-containing protein n=1 Tax=Roseobacter sp. TaxID=1907202 RepID=UPI0025EDECF9|nr:STAS/SEC14 domain-containing protein [Roseobacter sp.]
MQYSEFGSVAEIPTTTDDTFAFTVKGHIGEETSEVLAAYMNDVFDRHDDVSMLLDLTEFTGSDSSSILNREVLKSRLRSLTHMKRYAVIGAPEAAGRMISLFDHLIPVEAKAFASDETDAAWAFVGARPAAT